MYGSLIAGSMKLWLKAGEGLKAPRSHGRLQPTGVQFECCEHSLTVVTGSKMCWLPTIWRILVVLAAISGGGKSHPS